MADVNENNDAEAVLDTLTKEQLESARKAYDEKKQRFDVSPTKNQLLGRYTVVCLVLNRTIGSGIFTVPPKVLAGTGSPGGALMVWAFSGVISICGCYCWLELGLTLPRRKIIENQILRRVSTPRSGGEKNYLEYIFKKPTFFMTSVYGIMFIILGNISGNAVAFAIYVLIAAGRDPIKSALNDHQHGPVIGIAIGLLTFCAGVHIFSRRGGIFLSNIFATIKIFMVLILALLGFIHAGGRYLQSKPGSINESVIEGTSFNITTTMINSAGGHNLNPHTSFWSQRHDVASYVDSFLFAIFAYSGFEQPFYVLSEVNQPRKVFPIYTVLGVVLATFLYIFINISYLCVVPKEAYTTTPANTIDMASVFLHYLFDSTLGPHVARRVMAGLISVSIFGNVVVQTFTAARVKQEIAKEGILPFSLFFATGHTTPWAWFKSRVWLRQAPARATLADQLGIDDHLEKSPVAALMLHWVSSILLIAVTAMLSPVTAYSFLASLHSYFNFILIGALVSGGLLYLKFDSHFRGEQSRGWANKVNYRPWMDPLHVFIYFSATSFFLVATFVPPTKGSPYVKTIQGYPWWVLPTIGISSLLWGVIWWSGLKVIEQLRKLKLTVARTPYIEKDGDGNYVQKAELVEHQWLMDVSSDTRSDRSEEAYRMA